MKKRILLLEDDLALNETIVDYLEDLDFDVTAVYDGSSAEEVMYENSFELFLLDVNVPDINGFELLKNARAEGKTTPAIFITSLNAMSDVESGYESGCDDYIRKPFALKELLLRIESILKREFFHSANERVQIDTNIFYDTQSDLLSVDGKDVQLKNKEAKLLKLFLQNRDTLLAHETIYSHLWEYGEDISESALRTYIKNLRKLIGGEKIVSIKKLGYRFTS